ncbi:putative G-Protein Coupled Receptor 179 [Manis pentadactyla]|nr:putative G-Protein Coupled Receptor 179 [Manis pentadactyla]
MPTSRPTSTLLTMLRQLQGSPGLSPRTPRGHSNSVALGGSWRQLHPYPQSPRIALHQPLSQCSEIKSAVHNTGLTLKMEHCRQLFDPLALATPMFDSPG